MKTKKIITLILSIVMMLAAIPLAAPILASLDIPSNWAVAEMNDANTSGLLTPSAARDFHRYLTRDEFCELVVEMVERVLGSPLEVPETNPFVDDTDPISIHALKAWKYGIIYGVTTTRFAPEDNVERQQICAMMIRAIKMLELDLKKNLLDPGISTLPYHDSARIHDYAIEPVKYAYTNEIMHGDDHTNFNPRNNISSQECVAVIIRSFNRIESKISSDMTTAQLLNMAMNRIHIGYAYGDTENGVSRDLTLPTSSTGGVSISWSSSDRNTIAISGATGIVEPGNTSRKVILTATLRIGNTTRTMDFDLTTSPYSGDRLIIENAIDELDILYINRGDNADSVTGRIGLPTKALGIPVTWRSSNPSVVSDTGVVYVPTGSDARYATLTATITLGSLSRSKSFNLTVHNPELSKNVTLHGVQLGMSQTQVTQLLGTVRRTITASSTESWQLYYSSNRSNFIAVGFVNSRAAAVYSMASGVANQLKNKDGAVISVAQADSMSGVGAISYADHGSSTQQFAIMVYDSTSVIGTSRTLRDEGQEQLLFEIVNAFRARNNRSILEWSDKLGTPARTHSNNRGSGNLRNRVTNGGFDNARYSGGNTVAGGNDAFDAFSEILSDATGTSAMRTEILQSGITMFGAGFSGDNTGSYKTYFTYTLGTVTWITGVTAAQQGTSGNVTTVSVSTGSSAAVTVTLTMTPSGFNETFTATSSNTSRMTVTNFSTTSSGATITVTGVSSGTADIVVTGNSSGKSYRIPVSVGTAVRPTGLTVRFGSTDGVSLGQSGNTAGGTGVYMSTSSTGVTVAALTSPATSSNEVSWTATGRASFSGTGGATSRTGSSVTIVPTSGTTAGQTGTVQAYVQSASGSTLRVTFTVYFDSPLVLSQSTIASLTAGQPGTTVNYSSGAAGRNSIAWSSNNTARVSVSPASGNSSTLTAPAGAPDGGPTVVTARASRNNFEGTIDATVTVTNVIASAQFATDFSVDPSFTLSMIPGQQRNITVIPIPSTASTAMEVAWAVTSGTSASLNSTSGLTGTVLASTTGETKITVTLRQTGRDPIEKTVTINVDWPTISIIPPQPITSGSRFTCDIPDNYSIVWACDPVTGSTGSAIIDPNGQITILESGRVRITAELYYGVVNTSMIASREFDLFV